MHSNKHIFSSTMQITKEGQGQLYLPLAHTSISYRGLDLKVPER